MKKLFAALVLSLLGACLPQAASAATAPKPVPTCALFAPGYASAVGNTVNLSWATTNATGGTITTIGSVGSSGTQGVIPRPPTSTYVGTFTGTYGGTATCSITIGVNTGTGGGFYIDSMSGDSSLIPSGAASGSAGSAGSGGAPSAGSAGSSQTPTFSGSSGSSQTPTFSGDSSGAPYPVQTITGQTIVNPPQQAPQGAPGPLTFPASGSNTQLPSGSGQQTQTATGGIVPCTGSGDCNLCALGSLLQNILNFLLALTIPIAAGMFAYAGWLYFSNRENEEQIRKAHRIFWTVLVAFCCALLAWLMVQTALKAFAPNYTSWNSWGDCKSLNRIGSTAQNSTTVGQLLQQSDVGQLTNQGPLTTVTVPQQNQAYVNGVLYDSTTGCANGSSWNATLSGCVNADGEISQPVGAAINGTYSKPADYTTCDPGDQLLDGKCWSIGSQGEQNSYDPYALSNARSGPQGSCPAGYAYTDGVDGSAWCQNPQDPADVSDFSSTKAGGQLVQCNGSTCLNIAAAAQAYYGQNTSAGPDGGNKACAWSVNNVLASAGYAPIDGDSVANMEGILQSGRGTLVGSDQNTAGTQAGDIVVWKSDSYSHVGICLDNGCDKVISNSSSNASFSTVTPPNFNGKWSARIYHVNN